MVFWLLQPMASQQLSLTSRPAVLTAVAKSVDEGGGIVAVGLHTGVCWAMSITSAICLFPISTNNHGIRDDAHVIRLIQESQMRNWYPNTRVVLHILHQNIRKRLPLVPTRTTVPRAPAQITPSILIPIRLHKPRRAPRIRIDRANSIRHRLLRELHLLLIIAIELVAGRPARRSGAGGEDTVARPAGADAVSNYCQPCAGAGAEEVIESLFARAGGHGLEHKQANPLHFPIPAPSYPLEILVKIL